MWLFPTSSAVTEAMGVLQNVGPRELATEFQSKRNGRVIEQIPARKDFGKSWYLNTQVLHVFLQDSRSMNFWFSLIEQGYLCYNFCFRLTWPAEWKEIPTLSIGLCKYLCPRGQPNIHSVNSFVINTSGPTACESIFFFIWKCFISPQEGVGILKGQQTRKPGKQSSRFELALHTGVWKTIS